MHDKYNDFRADAYFDDGSVMTYKGYPWGSGFEAFKRLAGREAASVEMNMRGSFWRS